MTPALVHHRHPAPGSATEGAVRAAGAVRERSAARARARALDWAEIQERMLVPLCEAVYERLETGPGSRVLGLGCGSGLALLLAARRGAGVCGVDDDEARLELAAERLGTHAEVPGRPGGVPGLWSARLYAGPPVEAVAGAVTRGEPPTLVTAFEALPEADELSRVTAALPRRTPVVLAGWGPAERCAAAPALRVATRLTAEPAEGHSGWNERHFGWCGRDDLEELALHCGLRLHGSGRVACPFGYADMESAVRGLLSTGLYDDAVRAGDEEGEAEEDEKQVLKELVEALHPHLRADGTVWMPNLFRYVVALT